MRQDDLDAGDVMAASATLAAPDENSEENKPDDKIATATEDDTGVST